MNRHIDTGSLATMIVTLVLFVAALFTKGFTHDLLLEAGVFLVSVKLIIMTYKNSVTSRDMTRELRRIRTLLEERNIIECAPSNGG